MKMVDRLDPKRRSLGYVPLLHQGQEKSITYHYEANRIPLRSSRPIPTTSFCNVQSKIPILALLEVQIASSVIGKHQTHALR
jgi:hypothetical protein